MNQPAGTGVSIASCVEAESCSCTTQPLWFWVLRTQVSCVRRDLTSRTTGAPAGCIASGCTIVQRCGRGLRKQCISLIAPHIRSSWSLLPPVILPRVSHLAVAPGASRERVLRAECNTYPNHHVCPFRKRRHVLSLNPAADGEPW